MVSRGRHPKAPVAEALASVTREGLQVEEIHKGHRWGALTCTRCGQRLGIWSTPRVPGDLAKEIRRFDRKHRHEPETT